MYAVHVPRTYGTDQGVVKYDSLHLHGAGGTLYVVRICGKSTYLANFCLKIKKFNIQRAHLVTGLQRTACTRVGDVGVASIIILFFIIASTVIKHTTK